MGFEQHKRTKKTTKWLWEAAPEAPPGNKKKLGSFHRRRRRRKIITELETNVTTRLLSPKNGEGHTTRQNIRNPATTTTASVPPTHAGAGAPGPPAPPSRQTCRAQSCGYARDPGGKAGVKRNDDDKANCETQENEGNAYQREKSGAEGAGKMRFLTSKIKKFNKIIARCFAVGVDLGCPYRLLLFGGLLQVHPHHPPGSLGLPAPLGTDLAEVELTHIPPLPRRDANRRARAPGPQMIWVAPGSSLASQRLSRDTPNCILSVRLSATILFAPCPIS
eukprot:gene11058-biopygen288